MATENGNGNGSAPTEHIEFQIDTLRGDIRDEILTEFKNTLPWGGLNESQQERLIDRASALADELINRAVDIIASRGCDYFKVKLGKVQFAPGKPIQAVIETPFDALALGQLALRSGDTVILIARDAHEFLGERAEAKADVIGDLAIPKPAEHGTEAQAN